MTRVQIESIIHFPATANVSPNRQHHCKWKTLTTHTVVIQLCFNFRYILSKRTIAILIFLKIESFIHFPATANVSPNRQHHCKWKQNAKSGPNPSRRRHLGRRPTCTRAHRWAIISNSIVQQTLDLCIRCGGVVTNKKLTNLIKNPERFCNVCNTNDVQDLRRFQNQSVQKCLL